VAARANREGAVGDPMADLEGLRDDLGLGGPGVALVRRDEDGLPVMVRWLDAGTRRVVREVDQRPVGQDHDLVADREQVRVAADSPGRLVRDAAVGAPREERRTAERERVELRSDALA